MSEKKKTDVEKTEIVFGGMNGGVVIKDYCAKVGVSCSSYYTWKKAVLDAISTKAFSKKR